MSRIRRSAARWALRGLGLVLFAIVLARTDLPAAAELLAGADPRGIAAALALSALATLSKAARWGLLLRDAGIEVGKGWLVRVSWAASSLGMITPGKLGELARIGYLRERGHGWDLALRTVILDRLFDVFNVLSFALAGVLVWGRLTGQPVVGILAPTGVLFAAVLAMFLWRERLVESLGRLASSMVDRFQPARSARSIRNGHGVRLPRRGALAGAALASIIFYVLLVARIYALAWSVGLRPAWWAFFSMSAMTFLVMMLPISLLDVGTRDVSFVYFYGLLGIQESASVAISALLLGVVMAQTTVGIALWLWRPPRLGEPTSTGGRAVEASGAV